MVIIVPFVCYLAFALGRRTLFEPLRSMPLEFIVELATRTVSMTYNWRKCKEPQQVRIARQVSLASKWKVLIYTRVGKVHRLLQTRSTSEDSGGVFLSLHRNALECPGIVEAYTFGQSSASRNCGVYECILLNELSGCGVLSLLNRGLMQTRIAGSWEALQTPTPHCGPFLA